MRQDQPGPQSLFQVAALDLLADATEVIPGVDVGIVVVATSMGDSHIHGILHGMEAGGSRLLTSCSRWDAPCLVFLRGPVSHHAYCHRLREELCGCRIGWFSAGSIHSREAESLLSTQWGLSGWRGLHPEIRGPC